MPKKKTDFKVLLSMKIVSNIYAHGLFKFLQKSEQDKASLAFYRFSPTCLINSINRGSYMSAHVLLNFLN